MAITTLSLLAVGCSKKTEQKDLKEFTHDNYGEVALCEYKGIEVDKPIYTIAQEDIDSYIESLAYEYAESNVVERASQEGDCLALTFTMSCNNEILYDYTDEPYYLYIGDKEFGSEFDSKITGKKAGENIKFSISYEEDYEDAECAGKTIDYDVTITEVTEETYPEINDDFITNELGYESYDDMIESVKKELSAENDNESIYAVNENIIQYLITNSTFNSHSESLYESCKTSIEEGYVEYAEMFGCSTVDELYEMFGMTSEDVETEIMNQVYRTIVIDAISEKEDMALTNTEYNDGITTLVNDMGYESSEDLIADYGEDSLYMWILEEKVLNFLVDNAKITEVEYNEEDFE